MASDQRHARERRRFFLGVIASLATGLAANALLADADVSLWPPHARSIPSEFVIFAVLAPAALLILFVDSALMPLRVRARKEHLPLAHLRNVPLIALRDVACRLHAWLAAFAFADAAYSATRAILLPAVAATRFESHLTGISLMAGLLAAAAIVLGYEWVDARLRAPERSVVRDIPGTAAIRWHGAGGLLTIVVIGSFSGVDDASGMVLSLPFMTFSAWLGFSAAIAFLPVPPAAERPIWVFVDGDGRRKSTHLTFVPVPPAVGPPIRVFVNDDERRKSTHFDVVDEWFADYEPDTTVVLASPLSPAYVGEQFVAAFSAGCHDLLAPRDTAGLDEWLRLQKPSGTEWTSGRVRELYATGELLLSAAERCVEPDHIALLLSADDDYVMRWRAQVNTRHQLVMQERTVREASAMRVALGELRRSLAHPKPPADPDAIPRLRSRRLLLVSHLLERLGTAAFVTYALIAAATSISGVVDTARWQSRMLFVYIAATLLTGIWTDANADPERRLSSNLSAFSVGVALCLLGVTLGYLSNGSVALGATFVTAGIASCQHAIVMFVDRTHAVDGSQRTVSFALLQVVRGIGLSLGIAVATAAPIVVALLGTSAYVLSVVLVVFALRRPPLRDNIGVSTPMRDRLPSTALLFSAGVVLALLGDARFFVVVACAVIAVTLLHAGKYVAAVVAAAFLLGRGALQRSRSLLVGLQYLAPLLGASALAAAFYNEWYVAVAAFLIVAAAVVAGSTLLLDLGDPPSELTSSRIGTVLLVTLLYLGCWTAIAYVYDEIGLTLRAPFFPAITPVWEAPTRTLALFLTLTFLLVAGAAVRYIATMGAARYMLFGIGLFGCAATAILASGSAATPDEIMPTGWQAAVVIALVVGELLVAASALPLLLDSVSERRRNLAVAIWLATPVIAFELVSATGFAVAAADVTQARVTLIQAAGMFAFLGVVWIAFVRRRRATH